MQAGNRYRGSYGARHSHSRLNIGLGFVAIDILLCLVWMLGPAPTPVKALVFVLNVAAFLLYKFDKQRAIEGGRRIPEKWLFAITLSGGMMGADLARRLFRHKTLKPSFSICIFLALMIQLLALCAVEDLGDAQPAQPTTQQIAPRADTAPSHVSHHRAHAHQSNAHAASAVE